MNDPKDKKKISPDSTDDETTKKYHDEDIMEAVFGDDDDDNEVLLGEGEVPADDFDKLNTQKKKKKKAESKEEIEDEDVDDTEIQSPTRRQAQIRAERNRQIRQHGKRLRKAGRSWPQISEEIAGMLFIASPSNGLKAITAETIRRILATSTGR